MSSRESIPVRTRELVVRALDALADGDLHLVEACLEELDAMLARHFAGWVMLSDFADIPDMSVFNDEGGGS
jgi:hypothetical protein